MARVNFFKQLELASSYMLSSRNEEAYALLVKVNKFVDEGSYVKSKRRKQFLGFRFLPEDEIAQTMGITNASVRRLRMEVSNILFELFSEKFFDILYSGNIEKCKSIFSIVSGELSLEEICSYSVSLLISKIPSKEKEFEVGECFEELKFLAKHSNQVMNKELKDLDKEKLAYLVKLSKDGRELRKKVELAKLWRNLTT